MTPILEDPIEYLLVKLRTAGPRWIAGLAGLPGSGKSTFASRLANEVNRRAGSLVMMALGMDGFHLTKAELHQMPNPDEAFARRGAPWTFDPAALSHRLKRLRIGAGIGAVEWPDFQHEVGDPVESAYFVLPEVRLILVEGLYLLHEAHRWDAVGESLDERWYLDVPAKVATERLTRRHMAAWGLTREEAHARIASNDGLNAVTVAATRARADWLVMEG